VLTRQWKLREAEPYQVERLRRALRIPAFLARLLAARGWTDVEEARRILWPSLRDLTEPEEFPGAEEAANRIAEAVQKGQKVVVYGDYDADGICATSILVGCLKLAGGQVEYYIPHRIEEGYGLNRQALSYLKVERGASVVVTVDCGIRSVEEAEYARQLGLELIITDHHHLGATLPRAHTIVHPQLGGPSRCLNLCGAAVALKVAWAVARQLSGQQRLPARYRDFLLNCLSWVAIATIADVVPLTGENRILTRYGLKALQEKPPVGLAALMKVAGVDPSQGLDSETVSFQLAPRLNAAGRLGDTRDAVELLLAVDEARAAELAQQLDQLNQQRRARERQTYREALEVAEQVHDLERDPAIVLAKEGWHAGVLGIVAGQLARRFWRPAVLIAVQEDSAQGSGRSIPGYDLCRALEDCREDLQSFGGHSGAVGLRLAPAAVDRFRRALCTHARAQLGAALSREVLVADSEVTLGELTPPTVRWIEALGPFGPGHERPLLLGAGLELVELPRPVGAHQQHVVFRVRQNGLTYRAVAFGMAERAGELQLGSRYDLLFYPQLENYQGFLSVELHVKDFRPTVFREET
jgi:single-stranded-DNA-specific exonuclease